MSNSWRENKLFSGFSDEELDNIEKLMQKRSVGANEYIIREGDPAEEIYIIDKGEVDVLKTEQGKNREHWIASFSEGEVIGDLALLDKGTRSASVRCSQPTDLLIIPFDKLRPVLDSKEAASPEQQTINYTYTRIISNLSEILSKRLRNSGNKALEDAQLRLVMGQFIIFILVLTSVYTLTLASLPMMQSLIKGVSTAYISVPLEFIFAFLCWLFIQASGYPGSYFGLTFNNWKKSLWEGVIYSIPIMVVMILIKWFSIQGQPDASVFSITKLIENKGLTNFLLFSFIYILFAPIQEFIVRGALQSSLQSFIVSRHRILLAIVISNLVFGVAHLHISFQIAILSSLAGLFWGWLYSRTQNLIGVSVSHVMLGLLLSYLADPKLLS